jgi:LCP family protein required for cell wall assembly
VLLLSAVSWALQSTILGNIQHFAVSGELGDHRPAKLNSSENILILGSDSRVGLGNAYGTNISGARSDTIILIHISPGGRQVTGISFPRDSMVNIPSCQVGSDHVDPAYYGMINSAFDEGPGCTWHTLETLTGIHIDHFVDVDFTGFQQVVSALGGVEICLPKAVDDPKSQLNLAAGKHLVTGKQALAYVRERYDMGDGSDLDRIHRQQLFMGSIVKKLTSNGTLSDPTTLISAMSAVAKSITTDPGFTLDDMESLALALKGISAGGVHFTTVPNELDPSDQARVVWSRPAADQLFTALRQDDSLPRARNHAAAARRAASAPPATTTSSTSSSDSVSGNTDICNNDD